LKRNSSKGALREGKPSAGIGKPVCRGVGEKLLRFKVLVLIQRGGGQGRKGLGNTETRGALAGGHIGEKSGEMRGKNLKKGFGKKSSSGWGVAPGLGEAAVKKGSLKREHQSSRNRRQKGKKKIKETISSQRGKQKEGDGGWGGGVLAEGGSRKLHKKSLFQEPRKRNRGANRKGKKKGVPYGQSRSVEGERKKK